MARLTPRARRFLLLPFAAASSLVLTGLVGCVERELVITSEPQGALVSLNDLEVGRTGPVTREFTWYGTYDVVVRKEGYETLKTRSAVIAPWWQWVPFDLIAELLPFRLTDTRKLHYTLKPVSEEVVNPDDLVERGIKMRARLRSGEKAKTQPANPAQP